jgi:hypothetical protein
MQAVTITTNVLNSNPTHGEVYSNNLIKIVSDLRQVGGFVRFPLPITPYPNTNPVIIIKTKVLLPQALVTSTDFDYFV